MVQPPGVVISPGQKWLEGTIYNGWDGASASCLGLTLKIKVILPAKVGLLGNSRELQCRTLELWQNQEHVWKTKERKLFWGERGSFSPSMKEGCSKQKLHWSKLAVPHNVASHWLSCVLSHWPGDCGNTERGEYFFFLQESELAKTLSSSWSEIYKEW